MMEHHELEAAVSACLAAVHGILNNAGIINEKILINVVWNEPQFERAVSDQDTLRALGSALTDEDFDSDEERDLMIGSLKQSIDDLR